MSMLDNRLPCKTTLAKTDLSKLLVPSCTNWMIFLLQDHGRLHLREIVHCDGIVKGTRALHWNVDGGRLVWWCRCVHCKGMVNWSCVKHCRLLNKRFREVWDETFQVRLCVPYGYAIGAIRDSMERGTMSFYRLRDTQTPNKIICNNNGRVCVLTIPWQAFIRLDSDTHTFFFKMFYRTCLLLITSYLMLS